MASFLLYHPTGRVSGPRLGAFMGITALGIADPMRAVMSRERPEFLIRYGTGRGVPLRPSHTTINRRGSLTSYGTRLEQLDRLHAGGIKVPPYIPNRHELLFRYGSGVIGRDLPSGRQPSQGRGMVFYEAGEYSSAPSHDMFMSYLPKQRQFRVHVIGGRSRVRELIPDDEASRELPIWNAGSGFTFRVADSIPPTIVPQAVAAVAALRLDFGAVDVILHDGIPYVLEVNTAPGLCDATLEWYASHLGRLIGITSMPGWDVVARTDSLPTEDTA